LFLDAGNNDFRLLENSPCIGSGRYGDDRGALPYEPTSVDEVSSTPTDFELFGNYPNPFNASTTIRYSLSQECQVTIDIYDLLGNHVITLLNATENAGNHNIVWKAGNQPSGIYFYKIRAGENSSLGRMSLLK
jgi:hypothetical protein